MDTLDASPRTAGSIGRPWLWLLGLLAVTALIYLPGLSGPFLFDDPPNLIVPIGAWLRGETGWQEIVYGNASGLLGRRLSMLTFLASAALGGLDPFWYKVFNLLIHLACGSLVYLLFARLLPRDPKLGHLATPIAFVVTALWLLHPIQVSTVLYAVQRMAQLSTLFVLLAMLAYVQGRMAIERGDATRGAQFLFALLPAATLAAIFSKENGALVPLLCAVIEFGYFAGERGSARSRLVKLFFLVFLIAPAILGLAWYGLHQEKLLGGYATRTFTLSERLLSEPRALFDYIGALLLPRGPSLGLYTDDFQTSHSLLDPPTTLYSIVGLATLIAAALYGRRRLPIVFTGIGLFLAAHTMESSVFPLELYFEHRNYLPSTGFFLAMAGLAFSLAIHIVPHGNDPRRTGRLLAFGGCALIFALGTSTLIRAKVWSSFDVLAAQGASQHPQSMRAQMDYANSLQKQGRHDEVQKVFDHVATIDNPAAPNVAAIDTVALQCMVQGATTQAAVARIDAIAGRHLQAFEMLAFGNLADFISQHDCRGLPKAALAESIVRIIDAAKQPATLVQLWRSRFIAAKLFVLAGDLPRAQAQLQLAWQTKAADPAVGVFFANVCLANHDPSCARATLREVRAKLSSWDRRGTRLVAELERQLRDADSATRHQAPDPAPAG